MKVEFTEPALIRLKKIHTYYMRKAGVHVANKIRSSIIKRSKDLIKNPNIGQLEESLHSMNQNHRYLVEGAYKLIYFIEESNVYITDVFDTRRNPNEMKG